MNLVLFKHHSFIHCFVLSLKDQTYTTDSRKPFLEIDVKGGERDHIKAQGGEKVSRIPDVVKGEREISQMLLRGRERFPGRENTQGSQMLDVQEERCHMSLWGKDMFIYAYLH